MKSCLVLLLLLSATVLQAETRIVDGDTLEINGITYRINGIDAPEHGQSCGAWACGKAATEALAAMVSNRAVRCDSMGEDGYGRVIATCYSGGFDIGMKMVEDGHAWAFLKYSDTYAATQEKARDLGLGVWADDYQTPWDYRAARWQSEAQEAPEGCPIKGNISRNGKIYHPPWSPWYTRTKINEAKGERWFCDEAEAVKAGWRAPRWHSSR